MAIKEVFRRSVVYICAGTNPSPVGTGFFVDIECVTYVVTARHVLDAAHGKPLYVRLNRADGRPSEDILVPRKTWTVHPSNDVAIRRFEISEDHQGWVFPENTFFTKDFAPSPPIGPGDEVFLVGMFTGHPGKTRNIPAMRFGRISLMPHPDEQIYLEWSGPTGIVGMPVDAYLIDSRACCSALSRENLKGVI